ncbi:MAG: outer membrane beta-barrel protein [Breznakibacter sp.]|nr:outer membrane beta-barrel protein [Breznakibacter sp.]
MNAKLIALFVVFTSIQITWAQEENQPEKRKIVSIEEKDNITKVNIPGISVEVNEGNDTIVKVSMGQKRYQVIETDGKTYLSEERLPQKRFKGHYSSITLGFNWLVDPDFKSSFSSEADFMELSVGKSMSFGINPLQYSIGLQKDKNTIGLVLGAGWTVHNYRFDHNFRIIKDANGQTSGLLHERELSKNKLTISYINIPLMLEFQVPLKQNEDRLIFDIGGYCGFKIGSHTKMVDAKNNNKEKKRPDININPLQYGTIIQAGYKRTCLFATYNFSTLFEKNKGPELYPIQVGLSVGIL